jgi:hypothetical protein
MRRRAASTGGGRAGRRYLEDVRSVEHEAVGLRRHALAPAARGHHLALEMQLEEEFVDERREGGVRQQAERDGHLRVRVVNIQLPRAKVRGWGWEVRSERGHARGDRVLLAVSASLAP